MEHFIFPGEAEKNKIKQLKTIDKLNENPREDAQNEPEDQDIEADEYQHVKDPKNSDKTTLDNATEEQSKKIQHLEDEDSKEDEDGETNENMDLDETPEPEEKKSDENLEEMSAEKTDKNSDKPSKSEKTNERAEAQEEMEIEGEVVQTITVPRSNDTTAHCKYVKFIL